MLQALLMHEQPLKRYQALHTELNYSMFSAFFATRTFCWKGSFACKLSKTPHTSLRSRGLHPKGVANSVVPSSPGAFWDFPGRPGCCEEAAAIGKNHRLSEIWVEKCKNVDLGDVYI